MGFTLVYLTTYTFNYSFYNPPTGPASHSTRGIVKQLVYNKYSNVFYFVKKIISIAYNYTIMLAIKFAASGGWRKENKFRKENCKCCLSGRRTFYDCRPTADRLAARSLEPATPWLQVYHPRPLSYQRQTLRTNQTKLQKLVPTLSLPCRTLVATCSQQSSKSFSWFLISLAVSLSSPTFSISFAPHLWSFCKRRSCSSSSFCVTCRAW